MKSLIPLLIPLSVVGLALILARGMLLIDNLDRLLPHRNRGKYKGKGFHFTELVFLKKVVLEERNVFTGYSHLINVEIYKCKKCGKLVVKTENGVWRNYSSVR